MYLSTSIRAVVLLAAGQALGSVALRERDDASAYTSAVQNLMALYLPKSIYTRATAAIPAVAPGATAPPDVVLVSALAAETPPAWLPAVFGEDDFYRRAIVSEASNLRVIAGVTGGDVVPPGGAAPTAPPPKTTVPPAESTAPAATATGDAEENGHNGTEATSTASAGGAATIMADLVGMLGVAGLAAVAL